MPRRPTRAVIRRCAGATLALLATVGPVAAAGLDCEALRTEIDAGIRARGVAAFSLTIVDASASAPGRTVGTCERGARKIVYGPGAGATATREPGAAPAPTASANLPRRSPPRPVITECRDGSTPADGVCRR